VTSPNGDSAPTKGDASSLTGEGTIFYFAAKVMSKRLNIGNVANVVKSTYQLAVDTALKPSLP
jgi:hypothetical protein